ncbi:MAG: hypothetical protein AAGB35_00815 [Pseudomonadota bacterium]
MKHNKTVGSENCIFLNEVKIAGRGICTLCPACSMNTHAHYLHNKLMISYCDCKNLGGLYVGFCDKPFWKLFTDMSKLEFMEFAQSANAYVDTMRDLHLESKSA